MVREPGVVTLPSVLTLQYHTSQFHSRKHKKLTGHRGVPSSVPDQATIDGGNEEGLEWDAILSQEDIIEDYGGPPPLGGYHFLVT